MTNVILKCNKNILYNVERYHNCKILTQKLSREDAPTGETMWFKSDDAVSFHEWKSKKAHMAHWRWEPNNMLNVVKSCWVLSEMTIII